MDLTCNMCKKMGEQFANSCGYVPKEKRRRNKIDFPALQSPEITVDKCPVYYFNMNRYLYDWYNKIQQSPTDFTKLSFAKRIIYTEMQNYFNIRREYYIKREKEKNGS